MSAQICRNCLHWGVGPAPQRPCASPYVGCNDGADCLNGYGQVKTGPFFGCRHFEAASAEPVVEQEPPKKRFRRIPKGETT